MAKKITYSEAIQLINSGIFPKCKISSRDMVPVKSIADLNELKLLSEQKVQGFELLDDSSECESLIPNDAMEVSIDDAIKLLHDFELVYGLSGTDTSPVEIADSNELMSFCRSCNIHGDKVVLYWYV